MGEESELDPDNGISEISQLGLARLHWAVHVLSGCYTANHGIAATSANIVPCTSLGLMACTHRIRYCDTNKTADT
jgi:hypothetical protein